MTPSTAKHTTIAVVVPKGVDQKSLKADMKKPPWKLSRQRNDPQGAYRFPSPVLPGSGSKGTSQQLDKSKSAPSGIV
jgi:GH25 family lysozyme M1 (1,4-beta-N-acetylmuramidase)